jgi:hypothetical protein
VADEPSGSGKGRHNPFGAVDRARVLAALSTIGSHDPDVLFALKSRMLAPYRDLKRLSIAGGLVACALLFLSLPIFAAFVLAASAVLWRFQAKQVANVESGYAEYVASTPARRAPSA